MITPDVIVCKRPDQAMDILGNMLSRSNNYMNTRVDSSHNSLIGLQTNVHLQIFYIYIEYL